MPPQNEDTLERIAGYLRALVALTASTALDGLTATQKVERLSAMGLDSRAIAEATGISITTVAPIASKLKKKATPQKAEKVPSA